MEGKFLLVKETGCIIQYIGETLTDPHKGEYDSEYRVIDSKIFKKNEYILEYELRDKDYNYYSLVQLPSTIDLNNLETLRVLYGR